MVDLKNREIYGKFTASLHGHMLTTLKNIADERFSFRKNNILAPKLTANKLGKKIEKNTKLPSPNFHCNTTFKNAKFDLLQLAL